MVEPIRKLSCCVSNIPTRYSTSVQISNSTNMTKHFWEQPKKTWIKKNLRNFYVSQMSWDEQIEHLQLSEVGKWSNIRGAISEILLNIYLCLHFTKYVFTKYIFMVTFYLFKNISVTKLGWICWRPNPTSTKSNMKLK